MTARLILLAVTLFALPPVCAHGANSCENFLRNFHYPDEFTTEALHDRLEQIQSEPKAVATVLLQELADEIQAEIDRVSREYMTASDLYRNDLSFRQRANPFSPERIRLAALLQPLRDYRRRLRYFAFLTRQETASLDLCANCKHRDSQFVPGDPANFMAHTSVMDINGPFSPSNDFSGSFSGW